MGLIANLLKWMLLPGYQTVKNFRINNTTFEIEMIGEPEKSEKCSGNLEIRIKYRKNILISQKETQHSMEITE